MAVRTMIGSRIERALSVALWAGLAVVPPAQAANSSYSCPEGQELTGQFTPREARLTLKKGPAGQETVRKWTLLRLREAGQARYRAGEVMLVLSRSQAELTLSKDEAPLVCKLKLSEFAARPSGY